MLTTWNSLNVPDFIKMTGIHPDIYLFNPTCEYAIANDSDNWQPNRLLTKMESDLSALQLFLAHEKDYVLAEKIPSFQFISKLKQFDIEIPNFILKKEAVKNRYFIDIQKNKLLPWGWSPSAHKFLTPFKESCSDEFKCSPVFNWNPKHREITSRKFAAGVLKQILATAKVDYLLPGKLLPQICTTREELEKLISKWGKLMLKAPWSSSGRGLQPITKVPVHQKVWEKITGVINEQGYVIAEPLLNKVLDLAFQFELKKTRVKFLGISNFYTNNKGQYEGNRLNGLPGTIEKQVSDFAGKVNREIPELLVDTIESGEMAMFYEGFFGVDTLIYSDEKNNLKINPCLEINVRQTMGLLSLQLEKIIGKNKHGIFSIYYRPAISFNEFCKEMEVKYPLKIQHDKIWSGFFPLTDATENTLFGAYLLV